MKLLCLNLFLETFDVLLLVTNSQSIKTKLVASVSPTSGNFGFSIKRTNINKGVNLIQIQIPIILKQVCSDLMQKILSL